MLHDPLYDWSVGPSKVVARQAGEWEQLKQQEAGQGNRYCRNVNNIASVLSLKYNFLPLKNFALTLLVRTRYEGYRHWVILRYYGTTLFN